MTLTTWKNTLCACLLLASLAGLGGCAAVAAGGPWPGAAPYAYVTGWGTATYNVDLDRAPSAPPWTPATTWTWWSRSRERHLSDAEITAKDGDSTVWIDLDSEGGARDQDRRARRRHGRQGSPPSASTTASPKSCADRARPGHTSIKARPRAGFSLASAGPWRLAPCQRGVQALACWNPPTARRTHDPANRHSLLPSPKRCASAFLDATQAVVARRGPCRVSAAAVAAEAGGGRGPHHPRLRRAGAPVGRLRPVRQVLALGARAGRRRRLHPCASGPWASSWRPFSATIFAGCDRGPGPWP